MLGLGVKVKVSLTLTLTLTLTKDFDDPFFEDFGPPSAVQHASGLAGHASSLLAGATGDPITTPAQLKGSVHRLFRKLNMGSIGLPVFLVAVLPSHLTLTLTLTLTPHPYPHPHPHPHPNTSPSP